MVGVLLLYAFAWLRSSFAACCTGSDSCRLSCCMQLCGVQPLPCSLQPLRLQLLKWVVFRRVVLLLLLTFMFFWVWLVGHAAVCCIAVLLKKSGSTSTKRHYRSTNAMYILHTAANAALLICQEQLLSPLLFKLAGTGVAICRANPSSRM